MLSKISISIHNNNIKLFQLAKRIYFCWHLSLLHMYINMAKVIKYFVNQVLITIKMILIVCTVSP